MEFGDKFGGDNLKMTLVIFHVTEPKCLPCNVKTIQKSSSLELINQSPFVLVFNIRDMFVQMMTKVYLDIVKPYIKDIYIRVTQCQVSPSGPCGPLVLYCRSSFRTWLS